MALDDLEKRRSVPGVGRPYMRMVHPVATPDEEWRMSVGNTYGGNALTPPAGGGLVGPLAGEGGLAGTGGLAGERGGLVG